MSKKRVIIVGSIFLVSLFLGFLAGVYAMQYKQIARSLPKPSPVPAQMVFMQPTQIVPVKASNGQHNVLLITIDHFSTKTPQVEGVWLVIDLPNNSHLTLLPIYPAISSDGAVINQSLADSFSLDPHREPSKNFLDRIATLDLSWDSYIVLDRMGLAELVDQVNNADRTGEATDGLREVSAIPSPKDDPQAALRSQVALLETLCKGMASLSTPGQASEIINRLSQHLTSNLPPERIASGLHDLLAFNGSLFCEFPILTRPEVSQISP